MTNKIKVKNKKEFEKKIKEYRQLENSNEIIVIEY